MLNDLIAAIAELRDAIRHQMPPEKRLWDSADIAEYLGYGKTTTYRITAQLDFPRPVLVADKAAPRWVAREVIQWAESKKEKRRAA